VAIRLFERQLLPLEDILLCCQISERTFYRALKLWRSTGDVVTETASNAGRHRKLDCEDIQYLIRLIRNNPDFFLDELLHLLKTNRFISIHYSTVHAELLRCGISRKRLQKIAKERNKDLHADFISRMAQFNPEELGFIDEVSKDERTVGRRFGRAKKGKRAPQSQPFVCGRRTSTVGVLTTEGFVSGLAVEGSLTKAVFLHWMEHSVVRPPRSSASIFALTLP
jgi:transposase